MERKHQERLLSPTGFRRSGLSAKSPYAQRRTKVQVDSPARKVKLRPQSDLMPPLLSPAKIAAHAKQKVRELDTFLETTLGVEDTVMRTEFLLESLEKDTAHLPRPNVETTKRSFQLLAQLAAQAGSAKKGTEVWTVLIQELAEAAFWFAADAHEGELKDRLVREEEEETAIEERERQMALDERPSPRPTMSCLPFFQKPRVPSRWKPLRRTR